MTHGSRLEYCSMIHRYFQKERNMCSSVFKWLPCQYLILVFSPLLIFNREVLGLDKGLFLGMQPRVVITAKRESIRLNCTASTTLSPSKLTYNWFHDNKPVIANRWRSVGRDGSLVFKRVRYKPRLNISDEGLYQCRVESRRLGAVLNLPMHLIISSLTRSECCTDVLAVQGWPLRLRCPLDWTGFVPTFSWQANGVLISAEGDLEHEIYPAGVLVVKTLQQPSVYRCSGSSGAGSRQARDINVRLRSDPLPSPHSPMVPIKLVKAVAGTNVLLECLSPHIVHWKLLSKLLDIEKKPYERVSNNLLVHVAQPTDSGIYFCGDDEHGWSTVELVVNLRPRLMRASNDESAFVGSSFDLVCAFVGHPLPQVTWLRNTIPISLGTEQDVDQTKNIVSLKLHLTNLTMKDSGLYQCFAGNSVGYEQHLIRVQVKKWQHGMPQRPMAPVNLQVETLSSTEVQLSWSNNDPDVIAYTINYYISSNPKEVFEVVIKFQYAIIRNLQPFTNYTFYVLAYNDRAPSFPSELVMQNTEEDLPIAAPNIRLLVQGGSAILVEWDPLSSELAHGKITNYQIHYRLVDSIHIIKEELASTQHSYLLTDLEPNSVYEVRVMAGTSRGFPSLPDNVWTWQSARTGSATSTAMPSMISMTANGLNSSTILVRWQAPQPSLQSKLPILGFKLYFSLSNISDRRTLIIPREVHRKFLNNLLPNCSYNISLLAFNQLGEGAPSHKLVSTLPTGVFANITEQFIPQSVTVHTMNSTTLSVTWAVSGSHCFLVQLYDVLTGEATLQESMHSPALLTGLKPATRYSVSVKTILPDEDLSSSWSKFVVISTPEGIPSEPREVSLQQHEQDAHFLMWKSPQNPNGNITAYRIIYTEDLMKPEDNWVSIIVNGTLNSVLLHSLPLHQMYYVKIAATTSAGIGSYSSLLSVFIKPASSSLSSRQKKNIILGVTISCSCLLLLFITFLVQKQCGKSASNESHSSCLYTASPTAPTLSAPVTVSHELYELHSALPILHENDTSDCKDDVEPSQIYPDNYYSQQGRSRAHCHSLIVSSVYASTSGHSSLASEEGHTSLESSSPHHKYLLPPEEEETTPCVPPPSPIAHANSSHHPLLKYMGQHCVDPSYLNGHISTPVQAL